MSQAMRAVSDWQDHFRLDGELNDDERMVIWSTRQFAVDTLTPREGTRDVHTLILGRGITGMSRFRELRTKMALTFQRVLRFGDCDPSGIAYFPSYMDMLVGVVEEFFGALGVPWTRMIREWGIGTPTVTLDFVFGAPGRHGDALVFTVRVRKIGRSSVDLEHTVTSGETTLWTAQQRLVAISLDAQQSCAWPDVVRRALEAQRDGEHA